MAVHVVVLERSARRLRGQDSSVDLGEVGIRWPQNEAVVGAAGAERATDGNSVVCASGRIDDLGDRAGLPLSMRRFHENEATDG